MVPQDGVSPSELETIAVPLKQLFGSYLGQLFWAPGAPQITFSTTKEACRVEFEKGRTKAEALDLIVSWRNLILQGLMT